MLRQVLWHEQLLRQQGGVVPLLPQATQAVLDLVIELRGCLAKSGLPSWDSSLPWLAEVGIAIVCKAIVCIAIVCIAIVCIAHCMAAHTMAVLTMAHTMVLTMVLAMAAMAHTMVLTMVLTMAEP
jgi:hypothetical protein